MRRLILLWGLVLAFQISIVAQVPSKRALPDDNLGYPVLITLINGDTGSGFYLDAGSAVYLVTAKHVLFKPGTQTLVESKFEVLSYSKDPSEFTPNVFDVDLSAIPKENLKPHPSADVVIVKMFSDADELNGGRIVVPLPGITVKQVAKSGILSASLSTVVTFDKVLIGNDILVMGYPTSLGLAQMPQIDIHRPLLRKGLVAGEDPQKRSIVLDCPSYPGNSGGPVIEVDREGFALHFSIIGVVSQYVPYADAGKSFFMVANSGYSIATPMDFVLELTK